MIRKMIETDINSCAEILCNVYNNEMWQCRWSLDTATAYLYDYFQSKKFIGFVLEINKQLCGAMFCHEKIWWNNSELFIDEMFIQRSTSFRCRSFCSLVKIGVRLSMTMGLPDNVAVLLSLWYLALA